MAVVTSSLLDRELAKSILASRSPSLGRRFRAQQAGLLRGEVTLSVCFTSLLYMAFAAMDALLIPDLIGPALILRFLVGAAYAAGIGWQVRQGIDMGLIEAQCAVGIVVGFAAWLVLAAQSVNETSALYYAGYGLVFMMVANLFFNFRFEIAAATSGTIAAVFFAWIYAARVPADYTLSIGSLYVLSLLLTLFLNFKHNAERYRVFLNALSAELRQVEILRRGDELLRLSTTDALTGLPNRRAVDDALKEHWAGWTGRARPFGVILIDVDHFKTFNDRYGHQQGDACLAAVAQTMRRALAGRPAHLGRFGGEEFAVLVQAESAALVALVAEEVRRAVEADAIPHERRRDHLGVVTVSVGAAFCRDVAGDKSERTVTAADRALYLAKDSGRNCVRVFDKRLFESGAGDPSVTETLQTALAQGRIGAVYQPIWDVASDRIWAAEALMRLVDGEGRPVSPGVFIPDAERTGLIVELGAWILRDACRLLALEPRLPTVSVNVSAVQAARAEFVESVTAIVREAGIAPARLAIEITEGSKISGNPEIARTVAQLSRFGVQIWLDDFGTGFAGLSCLGEIPFDTVKVDRFFVHNSDTVRGAKLLNDIVDLLRNSGRRIVVEGIERQEEIDRVTGFGVDLLQGYHLGRPVPMERLQDLLVEPHMRAA